MLDINAKRGRFRSIAHIVRPSAFSTTAPVTSIMSFNPKIAKRRRKMRGRFNAISQRTPSNPKQQKLNWCPAEGSSCVGSPWPEFTRSRSTPKTK